MKQWALAVLVAGVVAIIAACGGGGGVFAGIDRLGVSTGTVSGFGSIIVNGVEYATNGTSFSIDDVSGGEDDLQVGQVVTVQWTSGDNGATFRADQVTYDDSVEGPVTTGSIDLVAQTFTVLGQTVLVDAATSFDAAIIPNSLDGLSDGNIVRISGLVDGAGNIRATRISREAPGSEFEVRGTVESLDTVNETFIINGLTIDYVGVLNPPVLANNPLVEVRGTSFSGTGALLATVIQIEDRGLPGAQQGDAAEVEGYVTRFVAATDFDVAGVPATTNAQTEYENGTAQTLVLNAKVEVEGTINAAGVLVAKKVSFRGDSASGGGAEVRVQADVDSVNAAAGTLVVAGVTVRVDALTRLEDQSSLEVRPFNLAEVVVGDYVEVRGTAPPDSSVLATLVQREDANTEGELRGPVGASAQPDLTVLGVTVQTDGGTTYKGLGGGSLTQSQFFSAIAPGSQVKVVFTQNAGAITADEIEIESAD